MNRRRFLEASGGGLLALAGCVAIPSPLENDRTETENGISGVETPPDWLHERRDCSDGFTKGTLELAAETGSVSGITAVVKYGRLSVDPKRIVHFAIENGTAETCTNTGGTAFQTLLSEVSEYAFDPYRKEHGERPRSAAVRTETGYHPIRELSAFDQVLL